MDKIAEISQYVTEYGYMAIFLLVFLQELGIPNPITNELVLLYAGYLAYTGVLSLLKIVLVTVAADFIGTSILYFIFYSFGKYILKNKPSWLRIPDERIEAMRKRIHQGDRWRIYGGRLVPFLRGYISVGAGLVQIKPVLFLTAVIASAITWSGGLVLLGYAVGPYWLTVTMKMGLTENIIAILVFILIMFIIGRYVTKKVFPPAVRRKRRMDRARSQNANNPQ
jgi:membrane protein DedA with SNARE-associated domain